jgi:hypothetical protein
MLAQAVSRPRTVAKMRRCIARSPDSSHQPCLGPIDLLELGGLEVNIGLGMNTRGKSERLFFSVCRILLSNIVYRLFGGSLPYLYSRL